MRLSVVVGTFNRLECLKMCLDSIFAETRDVKIYVSDAGSTDGTVEYLRSLTGKNLIPIFEDEKKGQARAYNEIFKRVDSPYVCWLSDDNVVVNGGLQTAVDILSKDASIGLVGLKTKDVIGSFSDAPYIGGISSIGVLNVNQGVLPTAIMKELRGFDERYRDYGIDPDLTTRVLLGGYKVVYTKVIAIHHYRQCDPSNSEYRFVEERRDKSKKLYHDKFMEYTEHQRPKCFRPAGECLMKCIQDKKLKRDLYNIVHGNCISWLDPIYSFGKQYYLIQRWPGKTPGLING